MTPPDCFQALHFREALGRLTHMQTERAALQIRREFTLRDWADVRRPLAHVERTILRSTASPRRTDIMRTHVPQARPQQAEPALRPARRPALSPRRIDRADIAVPVPHVPPSELPSAASLAFQPDPYLDYGRFLTPEGGMLFVYKDYDTRLRHILWRVFAWAGASYGEWWYVFHYSPINNDWLNLLCVAAAAIVNWLIVRKPVELYRHVEIRPDCMIVEGKDIFWLRHMEKDWPAFQLDEDRNHILCGVYGTRFIEYLTIRHFDDFDRTADVFADHLREAMAQLWMPQHESR
jgi:hypothetical protein